MPTADGSKCGPPAPVADHGGPLLIIGASARQSATSAFRSHIDFIAVDLFGDWDLRQLGPCQRIESFERFAWRTWLNSLPVLPGRFLVTGGMEKRCGLIAELAGRIPLIGVSPHQIERTKDPLVLAAFCRSEGIRFPKICSLATIQGRDRSENPDWLFKPRVSSGGTGIRIWSPTSLESVKETPPARNGYMQQLIHGWSFSSLYCGDRHSAALIGSTVQLVGEPAFAARQFSYCGSIGPIPFSSLRQADLIRIGNAFLREFELAGVFGVDWILDEADQIWLIEVNPRITASAELFEMAGLVPGITDLHLRSAAGCCRFDARDSATMHGKAILFSDQTRAIEIEQPIFDCLVDQFATGDNPSIADIPCAGTTILPGEPILTLFADSDSIPAVRAKLCASADTIRAAISGHYQERQQPLALKNIHKPLA